MKTIFGRLVRLCLALTLLLPVLPVWAGQPIPGVDIIVRKHPGGKLVVQTQTDGRGSFTVALAPGRYTIEIPVSAIARTLAKADPDPKHGPVKIALTFAGQKVTVAPADQTFTRTGTQTVVFSIAIGDFNADGRLARKFTGSLVFRR